MAGAGRDLDEGEAATNRGRLVPLAEGTVTELANRIVAPAEGLPVGAEGAAPTVAAGDGLNLEVDRGGVDGGAGRAGPGRRQRLMTGGEAQGPPSQLGHPARVGLDPDRRDGATPA